MPAFRMKELMNTTCRDVSTGVPEFNDAGLPRVISLFLSDLTPESLNLIPLCLLAAP